MKSRLSIKDVPEIQRMMIGMDLCAIRQIDVDAIHVYDAVLEMIDDMDMRNQIEEFRGDHEQHLRDNLKLLQTTGCPVPRMEPSPMGEVAVEMVGDAASEEDVLSVFLVNEHVSSAKYSDCLKSAGFLPEEMVAALVQGALDESRHFQWASSQMSGRLDLGSYQGLHEEMDGLLGGIRRR